MVKAKSLKNINASHTSQLFKKKKTLSFYTQEVCAFLKLKQYTAWHFPAN